jgi:hypothetical protein
MDSPDECLVFPQCFSPTAPSALPSHHLNISIGIIRRSAQYNPKLMRFCIIGAAFREFDTIVSPQSHFNFSSDVFSTKGFLLVKRNASMRIELCKIGRFLEFNFGPA